MPDTHDSGYHLLFSHPEMVEDLFKYFITEPWVERLDFSTLESVNAKFHADGLERREGDLIYRVRLDDGAEVYLYLLLEFQSQPDPWMALRVMVYVGLFYQQLVREQRLTAQGGLPPVFPLVLYNGEATWKAAQDVKDLIALPAHAPLRHYQPAMRYYLLEESRYPEGKPGSLVGFLFQIENCTRLEDILAVINQWSEHGRANIPISLRRALGSWIGRVIVPRQGGKFEINDFENFSEYKAMLATRVKQWEKELIEQGVEQGIEQGIEKGIEKGILAGEVKLLHKLLTLRFGPLPTWVDDKLATAKAPDLEAWGVRMLEAKTLEQVFV